MKHLESVYKHQGRLEEAEELNKEVLEAIKSVLGEEHLETLYAMDELACIYSCQGQLKQAESLQKQVLETRKRVLGAEHPGTLAAMSNLGFTYLSQGKLREAEDLHNHVFETSKRVLGAEHPDTLDGMEILALTWESQGQLDRAKELMHECFLLHQDVPGPDYPRTQETAGILAEWTSNDERDYESWSSRLLNLLRIRKQNWTVFDCCWIYNYAPVGSLRISLIILFFLLTLVVASTGSLTRCFPLNQEKSTVERGVTDWLRERKHQDPNIIKIK